MQSSIFISSMLFFSLIVQTGNTAKSLPDETPENGSPTAATETEPRPSDEQTQHDDPSAPSGLVELLDGASSAEAALNAMVAASNAGDDQAVMLMVDPAIRSLFRPEIVLERYAIHSSILERGLFGKRKFEVGSMLFWFTLRDMVRIRSIKLLETRIVDDKRVVFTVLTTEKSYHQDKHFQAVRHFLAIQRSDRWYVFRPFGLMLSLFAGRMPEALRDKQLPVVRVHKPAAERKNREDAQFEVEYLLPIEVIHEYLVQAANDPKIKEYNQIADKLQRTYASIVNRAIRGDYRSRSELMAAMAPLEQWVETLAATTGSLLTGLPKLAR